MKIAIFSDTHLTPDFSPQLCRAIISCVTQADRVIINGDFWDAYLCSFDQFVNSKWKLLFPLLKNKQTVYIYGNHDLPHYSDDRVQLFSDQQLSEYVVESTRLKVKIFHGHTVLPAFDGRHPWIAWLLGYFYFVLVYLYKHNVFVLSALYRYYISFQNKKINTALMAYALTSLNDSETLITGHSHIQTANYQQRYYNIGATEADSFQYALVSEVGITLHTVRW